MRRKICVASHRKELESSPPARRPPPPPSKDSKKNWARRLHIFTDSLRRRRSSPYASIGRNTAPSRLVSERRSKPVRGSSLLRPENYRLLPPTAGRCHAIDSPRAN